MDKQVRDLEIFLRRYEALLGMLDPLRVELPTDASPGLVEIFGPEPIRGVGPLLVSRRERPAVWALSLPHPLWWWLPPR